MAEFVDFGNILGRWTKHFVLKGGSKQGRGDRIRWLFALVQELELLRNFDLCFHLSAFATWELMPDIAQQAKVDLGPILDVVKRYGKNKIFLCFIKKKNNFAGDRKFWNGGYHEALQEVMRGLGKGADAPPRPIIPLLVYHSNIISGGFGGADSLVEKAWAGTPVTYINVSKFRSIGEQQQLLALCSGAEHAFAQLLRGVAPREAELLNYFSHAEAPSDATLTVMRAEIIPVSKHRESGKMTSFEQFAADVVSTISAKERRVVKWNALVTQLESDDETVRMRSSAPFIVCPRDAVVDGELLGGIIRALLQTAGDIEWASTEYWLLRRLLACLVVPANLEDIVMSCATLVERAVDSLPAEAEALVSSFVDMVVGGADMQNVAHAARALRKASVKMVPEIDGKIGTFEETLRQLKTQGGALSRAQVLANIGGGGGDEQLAGRGARGQAAAATVGRIRAQHVDLENSLKLAKAKLEHFGAQRALMIACQGASRDFAVLLDLWRALPPPPPARREAAFFLVTHAGPRWGTGDGCSFVHREPQQTRTREFLEKLTSQYASLEVIALEASKVKTKTRRSGKRTN